MANNDGFGSSEIMYPTVTPTGAPTQPMMPVAPYAAPGPGFGGPPGPQGPEILHGQFNQTWLMNCLRRRWLMALLLGSLLATSVGALLLWLFPLSSKIEAVVEIKPETTNIMEDEQRFSPQELEVFQETQLFSIKSQFVLKSALARPDINQLEAVKKEEPDPVTWLQEDLRVAFRGHNLSLIYEGEEDSEEMKKVVDAVIKAYEKEVLMEDNVRKEVMQKGLADLHRKYNTELKEKTDRYHALTDEIGGADSPIASTVLNMLINEVRAIQSQIIKKEEELAEIGVVKAVEEQRANSTTALEQAVAATLDEDPMLANYKAEEFALTSQLRTLRTTSKQGTSAAIKRLERSVQQLQQESRQYRQSAEAEARKALKNAPNDMLAQMMTEYIMRRDIITKEIRKLEAEEEEIVSEINSKGERNGELTMLASKIELLQQVESEMEHKLRSWTIQKEAADDLFRVLQDATATAQINIWQRFTIAGLGWLGAFAATCYGVALIEFRRRRLNGASDMDEGLGLRVLGVLPSVSSRKAMASGSSVGAQLSESIDNVRATLLHDSTTSKRQVVLITSPATMEGTTTVASHLALSLTRAGRRTLLIDGDIREPALHKLFGLPLDEGFCEVLRSDRDVSDVVRPTNTEGLWLLTAGHCDLEAVHALATDQPQPIFEKLREEFDFIIIDGAPVLGLADSISIGQHVDGAILTVLRDHSEVRKIHQATELLKNMGIQLLGSVVNGVPIKADRRIAQLHKSSATKPRKIATDTKAAAKADKAKAKANKAAAKAEKKAATTLDDAVDDVVDDVVEDLNDGLEDLGLNKDIEIDFEDFGLGDKK